MRTPILVLLLAGCAGVPEGPRTQTVTVPGSSLRFDMVRIPREGAVPEFWIGAREVTWGEFDRFYEAPGDEATDGVTRPSRGKDYLGLGGLPNDFLLADRPVTNLRYHSAVLYCEWLSKKTGALYRLPTGAEWTLARSPDVANDGWTERTSGGRTHAVGEKPPNARGVYDLAGNAWEYTLESDRPPDFEPVLRGGAWNSPRMDRMTPPLDWALADPNRPLSTWWYRAGHSQGFRVVRIGEPEEKEVRAAYAARIDIGGMSGFEHDVRVGGTVSTYCRVSGVIRNTGDRSLDEVLLKVYYLTRSGKPHVEDLTNTLTRRATFNLAMPVLVSGDRGGHDAKPLLPGEVRVFTTDLPASFDAEDAVDLEKFGASVWTLRFSR